MLKWNYVVGMLVVMLTHDSIPSVACTLVVEYPLALQGSYYTPNYQTIGIQSFLLEDKRIVLADPPTACTKLVNNVTDCIVVVKTDWCGLVEKANSVAESGGVALMMIKQNSFNMVTGGYNYDPGITIPIVELVTNSSFDRWCKVLDNNNEVYGTLTPEKTVQADEAIWIPYSIILGGAALGCLVLASCKLFYYLKISGLQQKLPVIVLTLEVISNLLRIIYMIAPISTARAIYTTHGWNTLFSMSFPYSLCATLVITFYWQENLQKYAEKVPFAQLSKFRIPCAILCAFLIIMEHLSSVIRGLRIADQIVVIIISGSINIIIGLTVAGFYIVEGIRTLNFLRQVNNSSNANLLATRLATKLTILLCTSGFALLSYELFDIGLVVASLSQRGYTAIQIATVTGGIFASLQVISLTQILAFECPHLQLSTASRESLHSL